MIFNTQDPEKQLLKMRIVGLEAQLKTYSDINIRVISECMNQVKETRAAQKGLMRLQRKLKRITREQSTAKETTGPGEEVGVRGPSGFQSRCV